MYDREHKCDRTVAQEVTYSRSKKDMQAVGWKHKGWSNDSTRPRARCEEAEGFMGLGRGLVEVGRELLGELGREPLGLLGYGFQVCIKP